MNPLGLRDEPTAADRRRMLEARTAARKACEAVEDAASLAQLSVFRAEIGAVVRSASPFLVAMLAVEGLTLDDAAELIGPLPGWPRRPRLTRPGAPGSKTHRHMLRHLRAGLRTSGSSLPPKHAYVFERPGGDWTGIEVVYHSLEARGRLGPARFRTRFGELRIELDLIPQTLLIGSVGRLIEEVVDHAVLRDRGWRIVRAEDPELPGFGQTLVVATGSVAYRLPWARGPRT